MSDPLPTQSPQGRAPRKRPAKLRAARASPSGTAERMMQTCRASQTPAPGAAAPWLAHPPRRAHQAGPTRQGQLWAVVLHVGEVSRSLRQKPCGLQACHHSPVLSPLQASALLMGNVPAARPRREGTVQHLWGEAGVTPSVPGPVSGVSAPGLGRRHRAPGPGCAGANTLPISRRQIAQPGSRRADPSIMTDKKMLCFMPCLCCVLSLSSSRLRF